MSGDKQTGRQKVKHTERKRKTGKEDKTVTRFRHRGRGRGNERHGGKRRERGLGEHTWMYEHGNRRGRRNTKT